MSTVADTRPPVRARLAEAAQARDDGMAQAVAAADPRVLLAIDAAIEAANDSGRRWSANTIRDQFPVADEHLVGARVRAYAARRPEVQYAVGREPSTLRSTHHHEIKVWLGAAAYRALYPSRFPQETR